MKMAQQARPYTPSLVTGEWAYNDRDPSQWEYHVRVKREKEALEYNETKAQEICKRIAAGEFLINVCRDEDLPSVRRCNQWMKEHFEFKALYDEAINDRLSIFDDEVVTIPDQAAKDFDEIVQKDGTTRDILDRTKITGAKLRVEVRFRHLRACKPSPLGKEIPSPATGLLTSGRKHCASVTSLRPMPQDRKARLW